MKPLKTLCVPRDSVFDTARRDTVLNLTHLSGNKIDGKAFLEENYVTSGMNTLLVEAFRRLQGTSQQSVFKLTQAILKYTLAGVVPNTVGLGGTSGVPSHD